MIEVHGEAFLDEYKWQFRGGESSAVEDVVCLSLGTHDFAEISERRAFERIRAALRKANIDWIDPMTATEWTFKLEELQKVIDTRTRVPWLKGTVVAKPEFTANLHDSGGTHAGTADFLFYFTTDMVAKSGDALARVNNEIRLEIAYVLFIDIVGYSKLVTSEQRGLVELLNQIVRESEHFRAAKAEGRLITVPTGDGMALVFYNTPEAPVECALEVSSAATERPELKLRMGIHSGPVSGVVDVSGGSNVAGAGINMAQRVMDCGDAGHILVSKHMAEDLEQYGDWKRHLHDLGECEVKHGVRLSVVNLYTEDHGNPEVPQKFQQARKVLSVAHRRFEPLQTTPEGQAPFFKRKIRVVLRNDADKEIEVKTPDWATDPRDLAIQPRGDGLGAASRIRLENKQTGGWKQDKWLEEADQLIVPPGYHFEAWVGLSHQYSDQRLERHIREERIGTLVFVVIVEGQKREVRIRVT